MKKLCEMFIILVFSFLSTTQGHSETTSSKTMKLQFSDPAKPGILKIANGNGDIKITGHDGRDVLIDVQSIGKIEEPSEEKEKAISKVEEPSKENEKAKGMKRITGTGFNIVYEKEENAIVISRSMKDETELVIKVPRNTSLSIGSRASGTFGQETNGSPGSIVNIVLGSVATAFNFAGGLFQGNITVENVQGDMEISTLQGAITVRGASGSVIASAMDSDVTVTFASVKSNNPMAFSTTNGDIDVTFPATVKSTVTAKNVDGDIFTDFDMEMVPNIQVRNEGKNDIYQAPSDQSGGKEEKTVPQVPSVGKEEGAGSGSFPTPPAPAFGTFAGMFGNTVTGKINGGGTEIQMTTIDGNIYIRKGK